jgi:predicted porin
MNRFITALAVLGAVGVVATRAHAQEKPKPADGEGGGGGYTGLSYRTATDTVGLYGLLDITLSGITNADANGDLKVGYQTSWFSGNRWGVFGKHVVGGLAPDFGVIFRLESEYTLNTGELDTPNVLFNRDAWIGFEGKSFGKLTFGRQNTVARDFSQNFGDPYGSAGVRFDEGGWTNTNNFKQLIYYAGSVTGTRMDYGIVYKNLLLDHLMVGLGYQFGEVPGAFSRNTTASAALGWNSELFNVSGFFTHANLNEAQENGIGIGGNVILTSMLRLNAGYFHYTSTQGTQTSPGNWSLPDREDHAWTVSAKVAPSRDTDFEIGFVQFRANNAALTSKGFTLRPFQDDPTAATKVGTGTKRTLYGSVFYHLSRRAEVYLAADRMWLYDGYKLAITNGFSTQTEVATGMRFRF